ncbi:hypothetical protein ABZS86_32060 [Streptomyces sp. NPDC005355]|uniref:hypothetical protein n=1 Tax=Streptomyces sp. NPDC005355 TaxID=3157038 RepID=UPI0033A15215
MAGDDGGYLINTGPLPDLGRALLRHRALDHRLGPAGDALVADARQAAPAFVYPEARPMPVWWPCRSSPSR